jgi:enoyl-CoA hydratase
VSDRPLVRHETERGIAVLTLDSPHNRNALSTRLVAELRAALTAAFADPGVRAVLLTHAGTTFCSGADLTEREPTGPAELTDLLRLLVGAAKPVVGLARGHVRAGGLGLLAACDIVAAGPEATFAFTETRIGVAPAVISLTVLPRLAPGAAARYLLTGEVFGAAEAVRIGLADAADDALESVLAGLRAAAPRGLAATKRLTAAAKAAALRHGAREMAELSAELFASAEAAEGISAFRERRSPAWAL